MALVAGARLGSDGTEVRGLSPFLYTFLSLPSGIAQGFITVTLSYVLKQQGVSVGAIAGLVSLNLLPSTWKFLTGPVLDMSFSGPRWFLVTVLVTVASLVALAFVPLTTGGMPLLSVLSLILGAAGTASGSSVTATMALTTPNEQRGAVAGWVQTGSLGGVGVSGGAGLWLVVHMGGLRVAALTLAVACVLCSLPMLRVRVPVRAAGMAVAERGRDLGRIVWGLLRSRNGILVSVVMLLPVCLGAASNLMAASAGDWHASADVVSVVTGVLGGLASVPGCIVGGYLCDRFPRRSVYIWVALANAAGEAVMALAPHTSVWFAGMGLANAFLLGLGYSALSAVMYDCLSERGAATISTVLSSIANVPLLIMTMVVGWVQTWYGSTVMLFTEAATAVVAIAFFGALTFFWRSPVSSPIAKAADSPPLVV